VVLYGGLAAGMAVAQANPALTAGELARQFARIRPRYLAVDRGAWPAARQALANGSTGHEPRQLEDVFGLGELAGVTAISELLRSGPVPRDGRSPGDAALLFNSSGTSGEPKTAVHTHATTSAFLQLFATVPTVRFGPADTVGLLTPISHLYGTAQLSHSLRSGARVVAMSLRPGDLDGYLRMLQEQAVSVAPLTPPLLVALARHPLVDRYDLSSLRLVMTGAAPLPTGVDVEVEARLGCQVVDILGATESWAHSPPADPPVRGSVGCLLPNNEAVIVEPGTGARLPAGQAGELWIRGPQVMRGYVGDDAATAATIDADGWLHTGDLCRFDDAGNLSVLGRLKELIKVGGYTVAPAEVEGELLTHPAVADAAVIGRPDAKLGEVPVAYVVLAGACDPAGLLAWLAGRLAPWKQLRDVVVVDQIPRNPTGKILRRALEREWSIPT
jgi:acyl-CoA synthetase (AMP-forming)/AMP-acid ligase II